MSARLLTGKDFQLTSTTLLQDLITSFLKNADRMFLENVPTKSKYTFKNLHEKASSICRAIQKLGLKDGDIVILVSPSTPEALFFIIGVWLSGAATTCINPQIQIDEIRNFLKTTKSKVVFAGEEFTQKVQKAAEGLGHPVSIVSPNGEAPVINYFDWTETTGIVTHVKQTLGYDHMIAVYFTSGTTGQPKGVVIRDQALKFSCFGLADFLIGQRVLLSGPLFWVSNPLSFIASLLKGFCLIQLNAPTSEQLLQTITIYKPSFWFCGVSVLVDLCKVQDLNKYDTSSLLRVLPSGSALLLEQKQMISQKVFGNRKILHNLYGSTETLLVALEMKDYSNSSSNTSTLGPPMDGIIVKIADKNNGNLLGPYCLGEICVKSPAVLKSYLTRELTDNELDNDGFWHIGDIGYYDEDGILYYQCRLKDIMKYREYQIAPAELELVIQTHPDVLESAVVGKPSPEYGDLPTAFIVLKPGASVTELELSEYVAEKVINEKKLRGGVYFVDSLPRNAVGKILRHNLVKTLVDG